MQSPHRRWCAQESQTLVYRLTASILKWKFTDARLHLPLLAAPSRARLGSQYFRGTRCVELTFVKNARLRIRSAGMEGRRISIERIASYTTMKNSVWRKRKQRRCNRHHAFRNLDGFWIIIIAHARGNAGPVLASYGFLLRFLHSYHDAWVQPVPLADED